MNRALKEQQKSMRDIEDLENWVSNEKSLPMEDRDIDRIFNLERQCASLKASMESLNRDYRDLQDKKNKMLKEMKATREQRVKRLEDSKQSFTGWLAYLISNPEISRKYGIEMEKMKLSMLKEKERLGAYHKYEDGQVDQPFLTPDTVKE